MASGWSWAFAVLSVLVAVVGVVLLVLDFESNKVVGSVLLVVGVVVGGFTWNFWNYADSRKRDDDRTSSYATSYDY